MSIATYKGTVENGQIKLLIDVKLPEKTEFYVLVLDEKPKFDLAKMAAEMPKDYQPSKEDFGKPVGRESYPVQPNIPKNVDEKQVAYYAALVQGWIGTRMEKDKSLLTLSSFGIGLIGTILTAVGVNSLFEIIIYGLITVCFLATIISSIIVFDKNADVLREEINVPCNESNKPTNNKCLNTLDRIMFWSFISGLIIFLFIGVLSSYNKLNKGDRTYESREQQRTPSNSSNSSNTIQ